MRKHEKAYLKLFSINFPRIGFNFAGSSCQSHSQSTLVSSNIPVPSLSIPFNWFISLYKELQPCFFCLRCPTSFRGNVPQLEQFPCSCGKGLQRFTLELQSPKNTLFLTDPFPALMALLYPKQKPCSCLDSLCEYQQGCDGGYYV